MPAQVVVVADDDPTLTAITDALRGAGYETARFTNPLLALDAIELGGSCRVLVTMIDLGKGRQTGPSLALMAHHKHERIKVVLVGSEQWREAVADLGEFLPEPMDISAMLAAVGHLLAPTSPPPDRSGGSPLTQVAARPHHAGRPASS